MKVYAKILYIVIYIIGLTLIQPLFFLGLDHLPDSYALGIVFVIIDIFLFVFVPIKIARIKQ